MSRQRYQQYYDDYWEHGIDGWSLVDVPLSPFEARLLAIYVPAGSRVLDFGCGDGSHVGMYLSATGRSYIGVDIAQAAVKACQEKGLAAICHMPDAPLPFDAGTLDVVVSFEVLEHLFSPADAVVEIHRVLRPRGYFVGSVPNTAFIAHRLLMAMGYFNPGGSPRHRSRNPGPIPMCGSLRSEASRTSSTISALQTSRCTARHFPSANFRCCIVPRHPLNGCSPV